MVGKKGKTNLLALRSSLARISGQLTDLSDTLVPNASAEELTAAKKQTKDFKRSVSALEKRVNGLLTAIDREQERRSRPSTAHQETPDRGIDTCSGSQDGIVEFGLAHMKTQFVPAIHEVLQDFPICNELGFCKVRLADDVRRGINFEKMRGYNVSELIGHQPAAVALEEWGGDVRLAGMVCSVFIASGEEGTTRSDFVFPDLLAAESMAAEAVDLDGRALFCSTVEDASSCSEKSYLVIPTDCTPEWRVSAGLPPQPYVDCGIPLSQTVDKVPGVHTPYEYVCSAAEMAVGIHVEDAQLASANMVLAGAPKVWLIVPPGNLAALEARIKEVLGDSLRPVHACSQFARHMDALLSPKLLEEWEIQYNIVSCRAGEMVVILPGAYHQLVNAGPNYAQAINFAMPDWLGPPSDYRFCTQTCPQHDPPMALHFQVQRDTDDGNDDDEGLTSQEEVEDEEDDGQERRGEGEEGEKNRRQTGEKSNRQLRQAREGTTRSLEGKQTVETREIQDKSGTERGEGIATLSNTLIRHGALVIQANTTQQQAVNSISQNMATEFTHPRKRQALLISERSESDSDIGRDNGDDNVHSHNTQTTRFTDTSGGSSYSPKAEPRKEIESWRDCIFRAAQGSGFDAEGILQALRNGPDDQPAVKMLRALQCICEVASIPWLLEVRARLLADPSAAAAVTAAIPSHADGLQDVRLLVRLHHNISTLQTISWAARYELAIQQLHYFQQFEAVVQKRKADTKKATEGRRNHKKRLSRRAGTESGPESLPSIQSRALVKQEIISLMVSQGSSERAAKDDLELYLKHGKTLHLLLYTASPSLLALFPLWISIDRPPTLDLCAWGPPSESSELARKELARPIDASCLFKLSYTLSAWFGQQLFIARPELKDYWKGEGNGSAEPSALSLISISEERIEATKPVEVMQLFSNS